jgi:hypothetical protein
MYMSLEAILKPNLSPLSTELIFIRFQPSRLFIYSVQFILNKSIHNVEKKETSYLLVYKVLSGIVMFSEPLTLN